jgi:hypothetical protein
MPAYYLLRHQIGHVISELAQFYSQFFFVTVVIFFTCVEVKKNEALQWIAVSWNPWDFFFFCPNA